MSFLETIHLSDDQIGHLSALAGSFPDELRVGKEAAAVNWVEGQIDQWSHSTRSSFESVVSEVVNSDALVVKGMELPLPPETPDRYLPVNKADVHRFDIPQLCISTLIGAAYGTAHVRGGRIIADVIPRTGFEQKPDSAFGSHELFDFHADGVLQPDTMPDYFSLHCLRNKLRTPTLVSHVDTTSLTNDDLELLQHPVFTLRYASPHDTVGTRTATPIIETNDTGSLNYNYYGAPKATCEHPGIDARPYSNALKSFHEALHQNAVPVLLEPGDIAIINNRSVLHARPPFDTTNIAPG